MLLVISEPLDISTLKVLEWLRFYKKKFIRINLGDHIQLIEAGFNSHGQPFIRYTINGGEILNTDDITSYWYRRGRLNLTTVAEKSFTHDPEFEKEIAINLNHESEMLKDFLLFIVEHKKNQLGSYHTAINNKLVHLSVAKKTGLAIPDTLITTRKEDVIRFYKKNPQGIIIKAAGESISYVEKKPPKKNKLYLTYTNEVDHNTLETIPDTFFPTLVQQRIEKKYELRIFYLKNRFFPMAIFSQKDEQTKIDFRRYNRGRENYRVPFNLPAVIKLKLNSFLKAVKLDTGSIDMLCSTDGNYYFLEVNPVGQFGMVSFPCNYQLEKRIALELIK